MIVSSLFKCWGLNTASCACYTLDNNPSHFIHLSHYKTNIITGISTYLSIITLNVSGLNSPIKKYRLTDWNEKTPRPGDLTQWFHHLSCSARSRVWSPVQKQKNKKNKTQLCCLQETNLTSKKAYRQSEKRKNIPCTLWIFPTGLPEYSHSSFLFFKKDQEARCRPFMT